MSKEEKKQDGDGDFYQSLRRKIQKWAKSKEGKNNRWVDFLLVAPDLFHLMCKLTIDKDVPVEHKAKLAIAIAYFVAPIDLIPEAIVGPIGYIDDIALSAYVLNGLLNDVKPIVLKRNWAGEEDILKTIKGIVKASDEMVGKGLWKKLMKLIDKLKT